MKDYVNLIVLLVITIGFIGCERFTSKATVYPALCQGTLKEETCDGKTVPLNRIVYKVSYNRQDVIYWLPGVMEEPVRLKNCVVKDKKNWTCQHPDGYEESMVSGKVLSPWKEYFYIEGWRWWYIHIKDKI